MEKLQLNLTVKNISDKPVYLVTGEKPRPAYDPNKNELGLGLDIQPANFHYFEFPKLKRLEPNAKANITSDVPLSSWANIGPGKWTLMTYVGILDAEDLQTKLAELGFSLKDEIHMQAVDFVELQETVYSNVVSFEIIPADYNSQSKLSKKKNKRSSERTEKRNTVYTMDGELRAETGTIALSKQCARIP
jgi:hypothetical protein